MTAYHATHPSPYADDCPDCTGMTPDPEPVATTRWGWLPVAITVALAIGAIVWRITRG